MTIGWGIIGIGHVADIQMAPILSSTPNAALVAVCSRDMERARNFAKKHGAKRAYDSLEKMLDDPELDALYIATPNNVHAEETVLAAQAGKHVLCDKPMALTLEDAERMVNACDKHKVKLGIFYQHRYHPAHVEARRHIQSGSVGDIILGKAQLCSSRADVPAIMNQDWRHDPAITGAGTLMGQGLHCIDLLRYLLDKEVVAVTAMTDAEPPNRPIDQVDYLILKFEGGAHGIVVSGMINPVDNDAVLYGVNGKITCKGTLGYRPTDLLGQLQVASNTLNVDTTFSANGVPHAEKRPAIEAFNASISDNTETFISGYNGLQMVNIASAAIESFRTGRTVNIRRL